MMKFSRRGLSLMELVVVLAILAAVTVAAVVATEQVLYRKRGELNQQTLTAFQRSLLGRFGKSESIGTVTDPTAGGQQDLNGFVADMGRPPTAIGNQPATQLAELWSNPLGVSPYGRKTSSTDPEVSLYCGWRGPYLDLPAGANPESGLKDGWGRELAVLTADAAGQPDIAADGSAVLGLTSLGSDGAVGVTTSELPLADDMTVWLGDTTSSPIYVDVSVAVSQDDGEGGQATPTGSGSLMVVLYLPDSTTGEVAAISSAVQSGPFTTPPVFDFDNVPIGPRVIRAYYSDDINSLLSPVTPIEVRRGGKVAWDLVLPQGDL